MSDFWVNYIKEQTKYTNEQRIALEMHKVGLNSTILHAILYEGPVSESISSPIRTAIYNAMRDIESGHLKHK